MIAQGRAPAAAADAGAAVVPEGQSRRPAGDVPGAALGDAAALDRQRVRARRRSRSASRWSAASRRCRSSAAPKYAVRVDVDPRKLAARGIGIDEVATAIAERQRQPADRHDLRARADASRCWPTASCCGPTAYGRLIIAYRNGNPVRLDEVAHVYDGVENDKIGELVPGTSATSTWRSRSSPAPTSSRVVDAVKKLLPTLPRAAAAVGLARRPHRPVGVDPRVGRTT